MEDRSSSSGSGETGDSGGDQRRPTSSRSKFGSLKKKAASARLFTSSAPRDEGNGGELEASQEKSNDGELKSSFGSIGGLRKLARAGITSSFQSSTSQDSEEKSVDATDGAPQDGEEGPSPLLDIGARLKAALNRHIIKGKSSKAAELKSNRRLSRRRRTSDASVRNLANLNLELGDGANAGGAATGRSTVGSVGYMQLRAANLLSSQTSESTSAAADNSTITSRLLEATKKHNFCDMEVAGKDGVAVKAPSFLLACQSPVLEEIFYPDSPHIYSLHAAAYPFVSRSDPRKVHLEFASQSTIEAAIHFCATTDLPSGLENDGTPASVRTMIQLDLFGELFKIPSLSDAAYRAARRMMNKNPYLVCAAFDEGTLLRSKAESENNWGLAFNGNHNEVRTYVLDFLRESPIETIMGANQRQPGVVFLSPASIEAIVRDEEVNCDEFTVWRILNLWVSRAPGATEDKVETARSLVPHIDLVLIDPEKLEYQVKKCAFVNPEEVEKALNEIEAILANESPEDKERVIVEGAGDDRVNGIYVLADDDIGLRNDDFIFIKEADEGTEEDGVDSSYSIARWNDQWFISNCIDQFSRLYSCEVSRRKGHTHRRPPKWGWKCDGGSADPAPTCTWKPSKEEAALGGSDTRIAPTLEEIKQEKQGGSIGTAGGIRASCGHALRGSLTLSQMMSLPEDVDFSTHQYASQAKSLDMMMNMSVDEGFDDEVAGYNVNYMSATLFADTPSTATDTKPS